ncbi:MAG: Bax inhibitor-1/YccA family protein [Elusimicrobiota bacterium]|jgi:uncharacterized YccA/Bax inhibitor family protein|nr:Bax inhibitor-1/YccA family protein [Elusimicrobiota bacterium]
MANPLLKDSVFDKSASGSGDIYSVKEAMTISGTINKSILLLILLAAGAVYTWLHPQVGQIVIMPALIIGFVLAMVCCFKQNLSPTLAPVYAVCEGLVLGYISRVFNQAYQGIVVDAIFLTIAVLFCMLAAYRAGILRATPMFKRVVILATLGIAVFYFISMIMSFFGSMPSYFDMNNFSTGSFVINLIIVGIAALNLIIDFDTVEYGVKCGAPKYMEWYCSFALMVTLVWLYIEILRLLARRR